MKKLLLITVFLSLLNYSEGLSQPCLPEGIVFNTQAQIDSFQIVYPNCTEIEDYVLIDGANINNLNGLSVLTAIEGDCIIHFNYALTSLSGIDNVSTIGGDLMIRFNTTLTSLTGLNNVTSIGGDLWIGSNDTLTSLTALENLNTIGGYFFIEDNKILTNLNGLENVSTIGGDLIIDWNFALVSLTGLNNVEAASIEGLYISVNTSLSTCEVESICDYLADPNGVIEINNNDTGCNSQEEVEQACGVSINENYLKTSLKTYPNPFTTSTSIEYELNQPETVRITFYNQFGKQVDKIVESQQAGSNQVIWQPENLNSGVYFYTLQAHEKTTTGKLLLMK